MSVWFNKITTNWSNKKINTDKPIKIALLGDSSTGKSSLFHRIASTNDPNYRFNSNYVATDEFNLKKIKMTTNHGEIKIHLWDTAGQEDKQDLRQCYIYGSDAIMILYDITNKKTITRVEKWLSDVMEVCGDIPVIVVGNKIDKSYDTPSLQEVKFRDVVLQKMFNKSKKIQNNLISVKGNIALVRSHLSEDIKGKGILYPFENLLNLYYDKSDFKIINVS